MSHFLALAAFVCALTLLGVRGDPKHQQDAGLNYLAVWGGDSKSDSKSESKESSEGSSEGSSEEFAECDKASGKGERIAGYMKHAHDQKSKMFEKMKDAMNARKAQMAAAMDHIPTGQTEIDANKNIRDIINNLKDKKYSEQILDIKKENECDGSQLVFLVQSAHDHSE